MSLSKIRSANEAWNSPAWYVSLCTRSIGTSKKGTQKQRGIEEETYYTKSSPFLTTKRLHGNKSQKELHSTWQKVLKEKSYEKWGLPSGPKTFLCKQLNMQMWIKLLRAWKAQNLSCYSRTCFSTNRESDFAWEKVAKKGHWSSKIPHGFQFSGCQAYKKGLRVSFFLTYCWQLGLM